jgi:hypothetical protein
MREAVPDFDRRWRMYVHIFSVSLGLETDKHQTVTPLLRIEAEAEAATLPACRSEELFRGILHWKLRSTRGLLAAGKERRTTPLETARLKRNERRVPPLCLTRETFRALISASLFSVAHVGFGMNEGGCETVCVTALRLQLTSLARWSTRHSISM